MTEGVNTEAKTNDVYTFLQGKSEMGDLIRQYPWHQSPVGDPSQWPQSLRTTLNIILNSKFPMLLFWGPSLTCFYNDSFRPSLGAEGKHPSALGMDGKQVWEEIWETISPLLNQVLTQGEAVYMEDLLVPFYRNGQLEDTYWTFCYSPVYNEAGNIYGVLVTCTETTQKVDAFQSLQTAYKQFQKLVMQAPVAIAVFRGEDLVVELANDAYLPIVGKSRDEFIGKPLFESLPETRETLEPLARELMKTGKSFPASEFEIVINRYGKNETCYFNSVWEPLIETDGRIDGFIVVAHEITEQVKARKKAEESEARFRNLIEEAPVATCLFVGRDFKIMVANEIMLRYWGKDKSIIGQPLLQAVPELKGQPFAEILEKVYDTGESYHETEAPAHLVIDGKPDTYYFDYTYKPLRNEAGEVYAIMDMAVEVSEQVKTRQQIIQAEERVRLAIESAELGTFEVDFNTKSLKASDRLLAIMGATKEYNWDLLTHKIHPDDLVHRQRAYEKAMDSGRLFYEARIIRDADHTIWIRANGRVEFDKDKNPVRLLGVVQDITEQKRFADKLEREVKERTLELENKNKELERSNANLEEFAHAASHDLKEPIRKIQFFTDRLRKTISSSLSTEDVKTFDRIENAGRRMSALIDDLLLYSHVSLFPHEMEQVNLTDKLNKVMDDLELDIQQKKAHIRLGELPTVRGYRRQLQQLFQNLLSNALKYNHPDKAPEIEITAEIVNTIPPQALASSALPEGPFHLIKIKDNGIGFEQEQSERIFQMFQRLHGNAEYRGTGVGLSIARKVVDNHKGFIYAESEPGNGATFYIGLPV